MTLVLWIALTLLTVASVVPKPHNSRFLSGGAGWVFLSIYWSMQPGNYIELQDYVNTFLVLAAAAASLFIAYIMFNARDKIEGGYDVFISLSRAVSVGGLLYFLFAEIGFLNSMLISSVTDQAIWITGKFGFPVEPVAWNEFAVNGMVVEIILACTAIESMAMFSGIISSAAGVSGTHKFRAFMISVPVVYILNLIRVSFTASAYGLSWFGTPEESFHISEHIITKAGSLLALLLISYVVLKMLPEVTDVIDDVLKIMKIVFRNLTVRYQ